MGFGGAVHTSRVARGSCYRHSEFALTRLIDEVVGVPPVPEVVHAADLHPFWECLSGVGLPVQMLLLNRL
jgi:hypothetical protein